MNFDKIKKILFLNLIFAPLLITVTWVMTYFNLWGVVDWFYFKWFTVYLIMVIVMPFTTLLINFLYWYIHDLLEKRHHSIRKITFAIIAWIVMESIMSTISTLNNYWFTEDFGNIWIHWFLRTLPVWITIWTLMSFLVMPKLQKYLK